MAHKSTNGFTLIELMVYIAIVAGILLTATSFAWTVINSRTKAFAVQEVQQNGRFILEKITQAARAASDVTLPVRGATGSSLELVMEDVAQNPTIFALSGNQLSMQEGSAVPVGMHSGAVVVTKLEFANRSTANDKTRNIEVVLTLEHINPGERQEWQFSDTLSTTIELRNE